MLHFSIGWTPLHEACNHGHSDVVSILINKGANMNVRGMGGDTPLHDAVVNDHSQVCVHSLNFVFLVKVYFDMLSLYLTI